MALEFGERLGEVVVEAVDAVLLRGGLGMEKTIFHQQLPELSPEGGIIADGLRHNVAGPGQGILCRLHALFRIHILGGLRYRVRSAGGHQCLRQRGKAFFPGNGGPGAALLLVGPVEILHLRQRGGSVDGGGELRRQLALFFNGGLHRLLALGKAPQVPEPLFQSAQGRIVHGAVEFLTVAGDEGNCVSLVQKPDHVFHVVRLLVQFCGDLLNDGVHGTSFPEYQCDSAGIRCGNRGIPRCLLTYGTASSSHTGPRS